MRARSSLLLAAILLAACGEAGPPILGRPELVVVNMSQFSLLQLMVHERVDDYASRPNLLAEPLQPGLRITLGEPAVPRGTWFLTVVREKVQHGALVAITTATGLELAEGTYELWVFDQSFRLWPPETPPGDASSGIGRRDAGAAPPPDQWPLDQEQVEDGFDRGPAADGSADRSAGQ